MNQDKNISEEEKIKLAKNAFAKFKVKISTLLKKQSDVFKKIMERINKRKLEEAKREIDDLYEGESK